MTPRLVRLNGATWAPFLILLLLSQFAVSGEKALRDLAISEAWLSLLHADPVGPGRYGTRVVTQGFLKTGSRRGFDPYEELLANIEAFSLGDDAVHNACEFPARFAFLASYLPLDITVLESCTYFDELSYSQLQGSSLSVVYAAGYLGNPASYYGHMMLRLRADESSQRLFDHAINYGAVETAGDDPVSYIAKGLFGGYEAAFSIAPYYLFANQYNALENRDLWVYELSLNPADKALTLLHLSELLPHKFDYFFTNRNCVSAFADLFGVVDPQFANLSTRHLTYPQLFLRSLVDSPLVTTDIRLEESRATSFRNAFSALSDDQVGYMEDFVAGRALTEHGLSDSEVGSALGVLANYSLGFVADGQRQPLTRRLALAQFDMPVSGVATSEYQGQTEPHVGRFPSMISWGILATDDDFIRRTVRLRPAFYDELDGGDLGFGARALSMMDFTASLDDYGEVDLERVSFLRLRDLDLAATGFGNDDRLGWSGEVYWERSRSPFCSAGCSGLGGAYGFDWLVANSGSLSLSASLEGLIHDKTAGRGLISTTAEVNFRFAASQALVFTAAIGANWDQRLRETSKIEAALWYRISDSSALRLELHDYFLSSIHLGLAHYF